MQILTSNLEASQDQTFKKSQVVKSELSINPSRKIENTDGQWRTLSETLSDADLLSHLNGDATYGYFGKRYSQSFCLDIDLHHRKSLNTQTILKQTLSELQLVNYIATTLNAKPSLLFRTRHKGGLHVYYLLRKPYCIEALHRLLKRELYDEIHAGYIELFPRPTKGLRLPLNTANQGHAINSDLQLIDKPTDLTNIDFLQNLLSQAPRYTLEDIELGVAESIQPLIDRNAQQRNTKRAVSEQARLIRYQRYQNLHEQALVNGNTNTFLKNATYNGIVNGIGLDNITAYVINVFTAKGIRRRKDTSDSHLKRRIKAFAKGLQATQKPLFNPTTSNSLLLEEGHVKALANSIYEATFGDYLSHYFRSKPLESTRQKNLKKLPPGVNSPHSYKTLSEPRDPGIEIILKRTSTRILRSYYSFLKKLVRWTVYMDSLPYRSCYLMERVFGYEHFTHWVYKEKCIPLPQVLLRGWYRWGHKEVIDFLCQANIMELRRDYYNPKDAKRYIDGLKGICRYYKIDLKRYT